MIERLGSIIGTRLKRRERDEETLATVASLVGAIVLARAVSDRKLSNDILRATRRRLERTNPQVALRNAEQT